MDGEAEEDGDLLGENVFAAHARAEPRVIELAATELADAVQHFLLAIGEVVTEPILEN